MRFLVCLAGLPQEAVDEVGRRPAARFTQGKNNSPIAKAIREPYGYRQNMSDFYLDQLAGELTGLPVSEDVAIVLAYVAYDGVPTAAFVRKFFPFALCAPLEPFYPDQAPKHERRHALTIYVDDVEAVVSGLRATARVVRDSLSGRPLTPLLLPLRNFQSPVLPPTIAALFDQLGTQPNPRGQLKAATDTLLASHPIRKLQDVEKTPYFRDDRSLRFKSPGRNRHGFARNQGAGHNPGCLIGSRVRLGGPFDALLHYDCDYVHGGVGASYDNCHDAPTAPAVATHVNIAPSDAVR